jgi:hypothetical protein
VKTDREAAEAAGRRCAEAAVRLLEVQFMSALLETISSPHTLECMVRTDPAGAAALAYGMLAQARQKLVQRRSWKVPFALRDDRKGSTLPKAGRELPVSRGKEKA